MIKIIGLLTYEYNIWLNKHNIINSYNTYNNWLLNDKYIRDINLNNLSYKLKHNQFSGFNLFEFKKLIKFKSIKYKKRINNDRRLTFNNLPMYFDWRKYNIFNEIIDQKNCSACWAITIVSLLESIYAIKYNYLPKLSIQQLLDCDFNSNGCNFGYIDKSINYIINNNGLCSYSDYPLKYYTSSCINCINYPNTKILNYKYIISDYDMMINLLNTPIASNINGYDRDFQFYSEGIYNRNCDINLNHIILIVGYGILDREEYYIIRNSWGINWGMDGYMYIGKGINPFTGQLYNNGYGQCGILLNALYITI